MQYGKLSLSYDTAIIGVRCISMIMNTPLTPKLIRKLHEEYMLNRKQKGDTWADMTLGDIIIIFQEEYQEVQELLNDGKIGNEILEEIKDLMICSAMLYQHCDAYCKLG